MEDKSVLQVLFPFINVVEKESIENRQRTYGRGSVVRVTKVGDMSTKDLIKLKFK